MKQSAHVPAPRVELVTVTSRVPASALGSIETSASSSVSEANVVEFTVMPSPEKLSVSSAEKSCPVTTTMACCVPSVELSGVTLETNGGDMNVISEGCALGPTPGNLQPAFKRGLQAAEAAVSLPKLTPAVAPR